MVASMNGKPPIKKGKRRMDNFLGLILTALLVWCGIVAAIVFLCSAWEVGNWILDWLLDLLL
jgi:hypothetical protein